MSDYISRQAAIQTVLEFIVEYLGGAFDEDLQKKLMERMNILPPTQPEITDIQAIEQLQASGWMQSHGKEKRNDYKNMR